MPQELKEIAHEALKLTSLDRIRLAEQLLESVSDFATPELETFWREQSSRRLRDHEQGLIPGVSADQVHQELAERIREHRLSS